MIAAWWKRLRRRSRIGLAGGVAAVLALLASGQVLPDLGLRYGLVRALEKAGWAQVSVTDASIALFDGAIVLRRVEAGNPLQHALGFDDLDLRFRWKPLLSRRISVERLNLSGLDLEIRRQGESVVINGLPLALGGGSVEPSRWSWDVTSLVLTGSRVVLTDGTVTARLDLDRLELHDLRAWEPDTPARFRLQGRINGSPVALDGTATPFAGTPAFAVTLNLEGLDLGPFAPLAERIGIAGLRGKAAADLALAGGPAARNARGRLVATGAVLGGEGWKLAGDRLALDLAALDWGGGRLALKGKAQAGGLVVTASGVEIRAGELALQADPLDYDHKKSSLAWTGGLEAAEPRLNVDGASVLMGKLGWDGGLDLDLSARADSLLRGKGKLDLAEARITAGALVTEARAATLSGDFAHENADGLVPLKARLDGWVEGLSVSEPSRDWLAAERLEANALVLEPAGFQAARLDLRRLAVLGKRGKGEGAYPWRFEARRLRADQASYSADGDLRAQVVDAGGAVLRATRIAGGFLGIAGGGGGGGRLVLGRLHVGAGSRLDFEDRTLSEPVRVGVTDLRADLVELDSLRPEHDSAFTLAGRVGEASLSGAGKARPFADPPGGSLKASIKALELPPLSAYAADSMGVHLHTGQLDAEINLSANQGKLDGGMELVLAQLFVAQPDAKAKLPGQGDMPIETVLDLLRGSDNRIRLSIPVRGDLANPDFDVSDAVGQAIGGALQSTLFTTLKVAFPLAALIGFVIDEAENPRLALDPVHFPPGAALLPEGERLRLLEVSRLMGQRPGLKMNLCGIAAEAEDWPALLRAEREKHLGVLAKLQDLLGTAPKPDAVPPDRDRLTALADSRAVAAKKLLVEEGGIDPGRLFLCRPRVETGGKAGPRVDLLL